MNNSNLENEYQLNLVSLIDVIFYYLIPFFFVSIQKDMIMIGHMQSIKNLILNDELAQHLFQKLHHQQMISM